jgi:hypothetical protein
VCAQACTANNRGRREHGDESWNGNGNGDSRGRGQLERIAAVEDAAAMLAWYPRELATANTERECRRWHGRGMDTVTGTGVRTEADMVEGVKTAAAEMLWERHRRGTANSRREFGDRCGHGHAHGHERGDGHCHGNVRGDGSGIWRRR